jgi:4-amino-4-deoxy-L-arabinose transferase-like glycosyltransferase
MDQKRLTWAALAAIALFAVFNLANLNEYGRGYDEQRAYRRGRYSVQLVANQLGLTSALSDEKMEDLRSLYHPPLFAMAYYIASRAGEELGLDCVASRQYFIVLWSTLGLLFLFLLTSRNFGHQAGLFAVLFLIFFPPFIAHSHFNPKDVPHLVSIVIALYFFDRFIERKNTSACIVSGVTYGLAVATGLNALFLVPAFVWVISIHIHPMKDRVLRLGLWMAVAIFALYATWPFLWHEPTYFFSSIRFFTSDFMNKSIMYLGNKFTFQTLPWHYTLVHFIASTPVVTLAFFIYGVTRADKSRPLSLILPVWLILPIVTNHTGNHSTSLVQQ